MKRFVKFGVAAACCVALGCGPTGDDGTQTPDGSNVNGKADAPNASANNEAATAPSRCVGVRGNGSRIFAHFGAMARIHEHYGTIEGVSGGSSASITSFLTESMYANSVVRDCGDERCSDDVTGLRISLMFKTIEAYLGLLGMTDEALAFQQILPIVEAIKAEGIGELVEQEKYEQARDALRTILSSDELRALVNPEVLELLASSPDASFHVEDIYSAVSGFGSFAVDSDRVLIRPGLLSFDAFAEKIGRIGSFYAAFGPADEVAWQSFFDECAPGSRGLPWSEISKIQMQDGGTCGEHFGEMAQTWRGELLANESGFASRVDDPVGKYLPALVTTSVITGDAVEQFKKARVEYNGAREYTFDVSYDDVKIAYWGQQADLDRVEKNPMGYQDLKTQKFMSLGPKSYREALSLSPAEPGLARALEISDTVVSTGGWSDLEPSLVLKNLGCEQVIVITRQGSTVGFGADVSRQLGMTDEENTQMFDPGNPESSVAVSLGAADGIWCTNWDGVEGFDFAGAYRDAYLAPLQTTSDYLTGAKSAYGNISPSLDLVGCTAGLGE